MKNLLVLLSVLVFGNMAYGQIVESEKSMSVGVYNALELELPGAPERLVEKLWKREMKGFGGKTKRNRKAGELFTDNANIASIGGGNTVDVYTRFTESSGSVYLTMWVDLGGAFLSSQEHGDPYIEAEKLLMRFALLVTREMMEIELEQEEKSLKKLDASMRRLKRDNERYHQDIDNAKEKIKRAEGNIEKNEREQDKKSSEITKQQSVVDEVRQRLNDL